MSRHLQNGDGVSRALRLVLVGSERVGKSAVGNTILGRKEFISKTSSIPVTLKSSDKFTDLDCREVTVIDTPGLFNTNLSHDEVKEEMNTALSLSAPGPHAFLLVIQLGRFTEQERRVMETLQTMLCPKVRDYTIVLFTHGDRLEDTTIDLFISKDANLRALVNMCGGRYHVFNNADTENRDQVTTLLTIVDTLINEEEQPYYVKNKYREKIIWNRFSKRQLLGAGAVCVLLVGVGWVIWRIYKHLSVSGLLKQGVSATKGVSETVSVPVKVSEPVSVSVDVSETVSVPVDVSKTVSGLADVSETVSVPVGVSETVSVPVDVSETAFVPVDVSETASVPVDVSKTVSGPLGVSETFSLPVNEVTSIPVDVSESASIPVDVSESASVPVEINETVSGLVEVSETAFVLVDSSETASVPVEEDKKQIMEEFWEIVKKNNGVSLLLVSGGALIFLLRKLK